MLMYNTKTPLLKVQREEDLRYLYENHEDFGALPSFLIIPGQIAFMTNGTNELNIKGKSIDVSQVFYLTLKLVLCS